MKTKEAIERVKARFDKWSLDEEDLAALQALGLVSKESEDEKIRKALLRCCDDWEKGQFGCMAKEDVPAIRAYLEKQKDEAQRQFNLGMQAGREEVMYEMEKEQNPAECIEFDNEFKNQVSHLLVSVLNKEWEYDKSFVEYAAQQLMGYAKHEIKPAEWSEEDIKKIRSEEYTKGFNDAAFGGKLKEWSEEDERHKEAIIESIRLVMMECADSESIEKYENDIDWLENRLKSIRPQPNTVSIKDATKFGNLEYERGVKDGIQSEKSRQWKPSKEQMDHLAYAYTQLKLQKCYAPHVYESLGSLYDDLKKHFSL